MEHRFRLAALALSLTCLAAIAPPSAAGQGRFDAAIERVLPRITEIRHSIGARKPGTVSGDHHSPTFRADDGALPVGMRAMAGVLWD